MALPTEPFKSQSCIALSLIRIIVLRTSFYVLRFQNIFLSYFSCLRCSSLTYANFSYCDHVTDAGVELLGTIPSLTSVDLSGCNISDQGIAALGNNPRYRDIIISECNNITDIGVQVTCF